MPQSVPSPILSGKVALVTGGGSGIGAAVARAFAREGAEVLICGRRRDALERVSAAITRDGGAAVALPADLTRKADLTRLTAKITRRWARLDVLVNSSGILGAQTPIAEYPDDVWDAVLAINLTAVFHLTKRVLPFMRSGGSIINLSSTVGRVGRGGWGAYAVSKFGIEGFSQVLAEEVGDRGIRVNTVNPGGTRTAMRAQAYPEEDPRTMPTPEDVAPVFVFLASDAAVAVTGQALNARGWRPPLPSVRHG